MASLTDLFEFLHSPNPDARQVALTNLVGHTPKGSALRSIFIPSLSAKTFQDASRQKEEGKSSGVGGGSGLGARVKEDEVKVEMLEDLKALCKDQAPIAHDAYSALVNLADTLAVARHLVDYEFLCFLVSYIANHTSPLSPLAAMLLSNITSHPTLTPNVPNLLVPYIPIPTPSSPSLPNVYYPLSRCGSSTIHRDFRPDMLKGDLDTVEAVRALVQAFEDGAAEGVHEGKPEAKRKGAVHFLASVFANISMVPSTRSTLLVPFPAFPLAPGPENQSDEDEPLLTKIVVYTEHPDTIRRGGALGCIKNAAMDRASHPFLLATEKDRVPVPSDPSGRKVKGVDVLPWVLSPLMGPEEIDIEESDALPETLQLLGPEKQRERDPVLRLMCVEVLLLLATSFTGREALRNRGTYTVIRIAHEAEKDEKIGEHMIRLVSLLKRDEGAQTEQDTLKPLEFGQEEGQLSVDGKTSTSANNVRMSDDGENASETKKVDDGEEGDSDLEIEVI